MKSEDFVNLGHRLVDGTMTPAQFKEEVIGLLRREEERAVRKDRRARKTRSEEKTGRSEEKICHENDGPGFSDLGETVLDLDRKRRCGFSEVVYGEGKSADAIRKIVRRLREAGENILVTRLDAEKADSILADFPAGNYNPTARTFRLTPDTESNATRERREKKSIYRGKVAIISAGTSDLPVAAEAYETARWTGVEAVLIQDVGVAGPHRLQARVSEFIDADAIVVVAGMEGALPSVVGGYVAAPVVAVPTSVGYGASLGGIAALLGMLNSCASNVTVVNIDAGFKAGYVAGLIARRAAEGPIKKTPS